MLTFKEALEQIMSQDDETKAIIEEALLEVAEEMGIGAEADGGIKMSATNEEVKYETNNS